jgi:phenylacetate-CoA ligase
LQRIPELVRARLIVEGELAQDRLSLHAELRGAAQEGLAERVAEQVRDLTRLRAEVTLLPPGSLPNDGRLIDDRR